MDTITAIRIGDRTYEEGRQYQGFQLPQFLLQPQVYRGGLCRSVVGARGVSATVRRCLGSAPDLS
jgi:hypothetical protein